MQANQLTDIVSSLKSCGFKKAKLLAQIIFIIIVIGNIGLYKIAAQLNTKAKKHDSKEKSIRRLLDTPICAKLYAMFIDVLFQVSTNSFEFAMDRTNWKLGKTAINLLILSFNWRGVAIPIYWVFLDNKGGNSNSDERKNLINWFISQFSAKHILNLYADREFPSMEFIKYLLANQVNFVFRIKDNILATDTIKGRLTLKTLKRLFNQLSNGNYKAEDHIRKLLDNRVYVSAKRNTKGELIVLISNQFHKDPFVLYRRRWHIECMFNKMKTKGLNLESTHITKANRIVTLFSIIALAYCYCCFIGELKNSIKPIKEKLINNVKRKSQSVFKQGFYLLQHVIAMAACGGTYPLRQLINLLTGNARKPGKALLNLMLNF
jgi:Transposase DDE domain